MARKTHFRRLLLCSALFAALVAGAPASENSSPTDLFQKGKTEFKLASYESSLATFDQLDEMSRRPGYERERAELVPAITFYRGANLAALGKTQAAIREFEKYLATSPDTRLDPSIYPKKVIATFKKAQEEFRRTQGNKEFSENTELAADYARFHLDEATSSLPADERWAAGPVRHLMTETEKVAWDRIRDPVERAEFVTTFWQKRDPNPSTPENESRREFEKRVRFADARFRIEEKRGSETDYGLVFALLGPPSYVRRFSLQRQEDFSQAARMAPAQVITVNADGSTSTRTLSGTSLGGEPVAGTRQVWSYKRDRLPSSVKFAEVDFEFLTKRSHGIAVLQKEPNVRTALEQARLAISPAD